MTKQAVQRAQTPAGQATKGDHVEPAPQLSVAGYLAGNWSGQSDGSIAVIVNPGATALQLMAWCWGELMSVAAASAALAESTTTLDIDHHNRIYMHRLPPVVDVMERAILMLQSAGLSSGPSSRTLE